MTKQEELIEKVARDICDVWGYEWDGEENDEQTAPEVTEYPDTRPSKKLFKEAATKSISTILTALQEPTEEMLEAGSNTYCGSKIYQRLNWQAMLNASPLVK